MRYLVTAAVVVLSVAFLIAPATAGMNSWSSNVSDPQQDAVLNGLDDSGRTATDAETDVGAGVVASVFAADPTLTAGSPTAAKGGENDIQGQATRPVPEPTAVALMCLGLMGLVGSYHIRQRRRQHAREA